MKKLCYVCSYCWESLFTHRHRLSDPGPGEDSHSRHHDQHPGYRAAGCPDPIFEKKAGYFVKTIAVGSVRP